MLVENLLGEIGFTDEQQREYFKYETAIGEKIEIYACKYMTGEISFKDAVENARKFKDNGLHIYTIDLLFVLRCTSYLKEKYQKNGISLEIFINSLKDVKYKLDECINVKNVFGISFVDWYERFLDLRRFAFGRLQFNYSYLEKEDITVNGYTVKKGDFVLYCHIPSAGPLKPELCEQSFKMVYNFFKDKTKDGILPIICESWLLYPPYKSVFPENSNTSEFIKNFVIVDTLKDENYGDAWRIFGTDFDGNADKLPQNTSMQKAFVNYIKNGGSFGEGIGVILLKF